MSTSVQSRGLTHNTITSIMLLFILGLLATSAMAQTCYNPDGTANGADYQPCNSGKVSMCCATNRANRTDLNICRSDGLCLESGTSTYPGKNIIWREGCTDPTWKDPACLQLCVQGPFTRNLASDNFLINMTTTHMVITTCSDGSMCCGQNNTACCDAGGGYFIRNGVVVNATSSSASTTTSGSSPQTSTSSSAQSISSAPSSGNGLAIGLGVGLGVAAVLFLALGTFFILKKRRRAAVGAADANSAEKRYKGDQNTAYSELAAESRGGVLSKGATHPGDGNHRYSELATSKQDHLPQPVVSELPAGGYGHATQLP